MSKRLTTETDVTDAIDWRLEGYDYDLISESAASLFDEVVSRGSENIDWDSLESLADIVQTKSDRRGRWSLVCALLAHESIVRQSWSVFWPAGFEVLQAYRQASRGKARGCPDALDVLIAEHLKLRPGDTPGEVIEHFCSLSYGFHRVLLSEEDGALICQLTQEKPSVHVSFHAIEERISKIRKKSLKQSSAQPDALKCAA